MLDYSNLRAAWVASSFALALTACSPEPVVVLPPPALQAEAEVRALIDDYVTRAKAAPSDARAHGSLGLVYEANELWSSAASCFEAATRLDPSEPLWELHHAICLGKAGRPEDELRLLQSVVRRLDSEAAVHHRLATALLEDGQLVEAEREFRRAGDLTPNNSEPVVGCARVLILRGQAEEARELLERVVVLDPKYKSGHYALGLALRELGEDVRAERELALGLGGKPRFLADPLTAEKESYAVSASERARRGSAMVVRGEFAGAIDLLGLALQKRPDDAHALGSLAWAHLGALDYENARKVALRTIELDADSPKAYLTLAFAYLGLERADDALAQSTRALELAPDAAEVHYTHGRVLGARGEFDSARAALERAIELDPADLRFPVYLGRIELETGLHAEAVERFLAVLTLNPGHLPARVNLVRALLVFGDFDSAREELDALRSLSPNHPKLEGLMLALEQFTK